MTPDERRFAEVVLGKVIRTERETLEWVAQFSERHAVELRGLREAEADAQRGQDSGGAPLAASFSLLGIVRESGVWTTRPPRSLEEFEAGTRRCWSPCASLRQTFARREIGCGRTGRIFKLPRAAWDPAKHPRLGASPNAGWFTPNGGSPSGGPDASGGRSEKLKEVCFAAGTPVVTDKGLKPIELVVPGDRVLAWPGSGCRGPDELPVG